MFSDFFKHISLHGLLIKQCFVSLPNSKSKVQMFDKQCLMPVQAFKHCRQAMFDPLAIALLSTLHGLCQMVKLCLLNIWNLLIKQTACPHHKIIASQTLLACVKQLCYWTFQKHFQANFACRVERCFVT